MFDFRPIVLVLFTSHFLCAQSDIFELARRGSVQEIKSLVKEKPSLLNTKDRRGSTPLILSRFYFKEFTFLTSFDFKCAALFL